MRAITQYVKHDSMYPPRALDEGVPHAPVRGTAINDGPISTFFEGIQVHKLHARRGVPVVALCFAGLAFEGYDLVSYGSALPGMLSEPSWHLGATQAGLIGSLTVVGMLAGSLVSGAIADFTGRRLLAIASCAWFSVWMGICAFAPNIDVFGFARLMVGLGIGAFVPLIAALAVEFAPPGKGNRYSAIAWSGYPIGGVCAALIAVFSLEPLGPRFLFGIGMLPLVLLVPLLVLYLPESPSMLAAKGKLHEARIVADRHGLALPVLTPSGVRPDELTKGPKALFTRQRWLRTVIFGLLSACGLLLTYGLNTWLPQLMRSSGYDLGSSLMFLVVLNVGATVVPLALSRFADISGPRIVIIGVFLSAAASILAMSLAMPIGIIYVLVFVAGAGTLGAQLLLAGFVATDYPDSARVAALSWISCVGRVGALCGPALIGFLLAGGGGATTSFLLFSAFGLLAAALAAALRPKPRSRPPGEQLRSASGSEKVGVYERAD